MSSEATQSVGLYEALAWLEANKKQISIALIAAVVVGFAIAGYRWKTEQKELAASDALLKLKTPLGANETTPPSPASAFLQVAEQYPSTAAGERAHLLAAGALFMENNYTEAQAEFAKFVRERPQSPFAATAAYGVASCLEAAGKQDEALAAYQNLSVRYPNASILDDAKMAMARIYEAKKQPESAFRIYDELSKSAGMSTAAGESMRHKEELLTQFPNLAKTNAPAVVGALTNTVNVVSTNQAAPTTSPAPAKP